MKDIQSLHDSRRINIRKVGIKNVSYPIIVLDRACSTQRTVAMINMYVNLPHRFKGTHMSRFVEILNCFHGQFQLKTFYKMLEKMKERLEAEAAHLELAFPYFCNTGRQIAASAAEAGNSAARVERYDCRLHGSLAQELDMVLEVDVPLPTRVKSQVALPSGQQVFTGIWGLVTVKVRLRRFLWLEDLIMLVEEAAFAALPETESVEAVCRRISAALQSDSAFRWYSVSVKNTVNGYVAFASTEWPEQLGKSDPPRQAMDKAQAA